MDETILSALKNIDVSSCDYTEWVNVGMALKAEGFECDTWEAWSHNDSRYHPGECEKKWNTFKGSANPVSGGTIIQLAKDRGWKPFQFEGDGALDWNSAIQYDGSEYVPEEKEWNPDEELKRYLSILFDEDDIVSYVTKSWKDKDERWKPSGCGDTMTAGELIKRMNKFPGDWTSSIGANYNPEAGAWIRFNPVDGEGVKNENVTDFRYALVESDNMPMSDQEAMYRKLELPIAVMVHSGGKSIHAIVKVDAPDYDEYRKRVEFLYDFLNKNGVTIDKQNRNPSRLSRMPGVVRGDKHQYIIAENIGRKSWNDWMDFVEGVDDELPEFITVTQEMIDNPPPLNPELIKGVLRCGHKMLISGGSKAGKSYLLIELAVALSEGKPWLGFDCKKSNVLYINLEIMGNSFENRVSQVYKALGYEKGPSKFQIWNLRGGALPLDKLVPKLIRRIKSGGFEAVIFDPIYKIITGDENNASEMGAFCNQFDKVATECGCAVIYCHHHSKGAQGGKRAMDRASGSGVFARDPDAQLDMIELDISDDVKNMVADGNATAFRVESSLREFPNFKPVNIWYECPLHRVDDKNLNGFHPEGSAESNLSKSPKRTSEEERFNRLETAYSFCCKDGVCKTRDIAEYLELEERTVRNYLNEFKDYFESLGGGFVKRIVQKPMFGNG